jgi:hypothetical protein
VSTWVQVARCNLVRPASYLVVPLILSLALILSAVTASRSHLASGYLLSLFIYFGVQGMRVIGRTLPFGLMLGASRRSFYSGTALSGLAVALVSGMLVAALQAIERATGGWGLSMRLFRVQYLLDGPWYATWLTAAVGLFALFVYGMWHGIVYTRWGPLGTIAFLTAQALLVAGWGVLAHDEHWRFLATADGSSAGLTALGLTGVVAALAVLLLAGGQATIRRVTV